MPIDSPDQKTGQGGPADQHKPMDTLSVEARQTGRLARYLKIAFAGGEESARQSTELRVGIEQLPTFQRIVALGAFHLLENLLEQQTQALKGSTHISPDAYGMLFSPLEAKAHSIGLSELFNTLRELIPADLNLISEADATRLMSFLGLDQKLATAEFGGINLAETRIIVLSALILLLLIFLSACGASELQADSNPTAVPVVELTSLPNSAYPMVTEEPTEEPTEAPPVDPEAEIYDLTRYTLVIKSVADGTVHSIEIHSKEDANYAIIFFDEDNQVFTATRPNESAGAEPQQLTAEIKDGYATWSVKGTGMVILRIAVAHNSAYTDGISLREGELETFDKLDEGTRQALLDFFKNGILAIDFGTPYALTATSEPSSTPAPTSTPKLEAIQPTSTPEPIHYDDLYGLGPATVQLIRQDSTSKSLSEIAPALRDASISTSTQVYETANIANTEIQIKNLVLTGYSVEKITFENPFVVGTVEIPNQVDQVTLNFKLLVDGEEHSLTVISWGGSPTLATLANKYLLPMSDFPQFPLGPNGELQPGPYSIGDLMAISINTTPVQDAARRFIEGYIKDRANGKLDYLTQEQFLAHLQRFWALLGSSKPFTLESLKDNPTIDPSEAVLNKLN